MDLISFGKSCSGPTKYHGWSVFVHMSRASSFVGASRFGIVVSKYPSLISQKSWSWSWDTTVGCDFGATACNAATKASTVTPCCDANAASSCSFMFVVSPTETLCLVGRTTLQPCRDLLDTHRLCKEYRRCPDEYRRHLCCRRSIR